MAGRECPERQPAIQSDLFAVAPDRGGVFRGSPDLALVAQQTIGCRDAGGAKNFIRFQIVKLEKDPETLRISETVRETRADFVGAKNELAEADLVRRHGFDFVGEDKRAGVECSLFILRNPQSGSNHADISRFDVLHNDVETIEAGMERNGFLI